MYDIIILVQHLLMTHYMIICTIMDIEMNGNHIHYFLANAKYGIMMSLQKMYEAGLLKL